MLVQFGGDGVSRHHESRCEKTKDEIKEEEEKEKKRENKRRTKNLMVL